ncbi:MAG TPA: hypothetical protein VF201_15300 [Nitrolancea sp.]
MRLFIHVIKQPVITALLASLSTLMSDGVRAASRWSTETTVLLPA